MNIINSDMGEYLEVGSVFLVYGINFSKGITYCYIFNGDHLFEVPFELFEIIDPKVSELWSIKVRKNGDITIWPELFYRENFFENFAEHETKERNEFYSLRRAMEQ